LQAAEIIRQSGQPVSAKVENFQRIGKLENCFGELGQAFAKLKAGGAFEVSGLQVEQRIQGSGLL
jgi:hypothetical protein